jgi:hypothetical protein
MLKSALARADSTVVEVPHMLPEPAEDGTLEIVVPDEVPADDSETTAPVAKAPTSDPLRLYVRQIGDGPLLTREEERELARRKDQGDEQAKRKLIESNLRLVMSITRNYTKAGVPLLDLLDDGLGLDGVDILEGLDQLEPGLGGACGLGFVGRIREWLLLDHEPGYRPPPPRP